MTPLPSPSDAARYRPIPGACQWSGVSRSTLYEWIAAEKIRAIKAGRRTLIDMRTLETFLESCPRVGA